MKLEPHSASAQPVAVTPICLLGLGLMTLGTGFVDAASLLALGGVFVANMTGNVVFMGFELAGEHSVSLTGSLVALFGFLLGALGGGRITRIQRATWAKGAFLVVPLLFSVAAVITWASDSPPRLPLLSLLAIAMGLRSALVRGLAIPDMTTTVLTLTLAGLAADSSWAGGTNPRWGRRLVSLAAMLLGALLGAFLIRYDLAFLLACAALIESVAVGLLFGQPQLFTERSSLAARAHTV